MDRLFFVRCAARRPAALALTAMLLLCPVQPGCPTEGTPVWFSMLFPQLAPQWSLLPWLQTQELPQETGEEALLHEA